MNASVAATRRRTAPPIRRVAARAVVTMLLASLMTMTNEAGTRAAPTVAPPVGGIVVTSDTLALASRNSQAVFALARRNSSPGGNPPWVFRSADGGATWTSLPIPGSLVIPPYDPVDEFSWPAPFVAADGLHLYLNDQFLSSADSSSQGVVISSDGGAHWGDPDNPDRNGTNEFGHQVLAVSPLAADEVYAVDNTGSNLVPQRSTDYGNTWTEMAGLTSLIPKDWDPDTYLIHLIPDATTAGRLYITIEDEQGIPSFEAWSVDDGASWRRLSLPPGVQAVDVSIGLDSRLPGQLLLSPMADSGQPADRLYGTTDGGATWRQLLCPGVLRGACPSAVIDNALGDGQSYGLYADGIHAFSGAGPAGPRLPISDDLPLPPNAIRVLVADPHSGAPIFVLGNTPTAPGLVFRSTDGGKHWQEAFVGTLPTHAAASRAPGALYVAATHHSVAPAFAALYHSLGLSRVGYPIDEAYRRNGDLVQDFERIELVKPGGKGSVSIAALGRDSCALRCPRTATSPVPAGGGAMYFPQSKHTLRGDFLRFWQQHGGLKVFGAPISEEFSAQNMDGSGRTYRMQYFAKARLELHPEVGNSSFTVQIGLLGDEAVKDRGW